MIFDITIESGGSSGPGRGGYGANRPTPQNLGSMPSVNSNSSNSAQFPGSGQRPPSATSNHSSNISNSHSSSSLVRLKHTSFLHFTRLFSPCEKLRRSYSLRAFKMMIDMVD